MNQEKVLTDKYSFSCSLQYFDMWRSTVWWNCTNIFKRNCCHIRSYYQSNLLPWALRQQLVFIRWYLPARPHNLPKILSPQYSSQCMPQTWPFTFVFISQFFFIFFVVNFFFCSYFYSFFPVLTGGNRHFLPETFFDTIKCMKRPRHIELWNYVLLSCRNLPDYQLLKVNATAWYYYIITIQSSCSTKAWNSCRSILPWPLQVN